MGDSRNPIRASPKIRYYNPRICIDRESLSPAYRDARGNITKAMHYLNTTYTGYFNKKYRRVGHLFQGRYKGFLIEKEIPAFSKQVCTSQPCIEKELSEE